jgi:multicomponent Na+:H+ antiporter subunit C
MSLALAATAAVLYATGTYLLLQRELTRIVLGLALMGHGAVLVLLTAGGRAGDVPIVGDGDGPASDPLVQALALTAVVITFAVTMFLLALAYRSWQLTRDDAVQDDIEDRRVARLRGDEEVDELAPAALELTESEFGLTTTERSNGDPS